VIISHSDISYHKSCSVLFNFRNYNRKSITNEHPVIPVMATIS